MLKRLALTSVVFGLTAVAGWPLLSAAASRLTLSLAGVRQYADGSDRLFEFDLANAGSQTASAAGRVVLLDVYGATPPVTLPIPETTFPGGGKVTIRMRWPNAPRIGEIRTLLVLGDALDPAFSQALIFWIFPWGEIGLLVVAVLACGALAFALRRLLKAHGGRKKTTSNLLPYVVEEHDTVVSLANRFDLSWQDIARANRLKPPYALAPGRRISIPRHDLKRPAGPAAQLPGRIE